MTSAAIEAIKYALETEEGLTFLRLWNEGEFEIIRNEWPNVPVEVFIGADSLFQQEVLVVESELPSSGFTATMPQLHKAAKVIISNAKERFKGHNVNAHLWAYRHDGIEYLSCDLFVPNNIQLTMPLTICAGGTVDFECWDEPDVTDMAEAMHLSGLVISALNAQVIVGRHNNEINKDLLAVPLTPGQTNGAIDLS